MKNNNIFIEGAISPTFIANAIARHNTKKGIGAHAIFLGQIRADKVETDTVAAIEYTAYPEMAIPEIEKIREQTFKKWALSCLHIHHSMGFIRAGEIAFMVFASSAHRNEAQQAASYVVEEVKKQIPIWKKEFYENGTHHWVNAEKVKK